MKIGKSLGAENMNVSSWTCHLVHCSVVSACAHPLAVGQKAQPAKEPLITCAMI